MNICFVVGGYPTKDDPIYAFIRPVVTALADIGANCTVISPQNALGQLKRRKCGRPTVWTDHSECGNAITILQPRTLSFSSLKVNGNSVSSFFWNKAVQKEFNRLPQKPDVLYAHFWDSAISAAKVAEGKIPVVAVSGESSVRVRDRYNAETVEKYLPHIKGLICVSSKNLNESRDLGLLKYNPKTIVLPNGFDSERFCLLDRTEVRKELGIGEKEIVASFVGTFSERKGINRVVEAAKRVPNLKLLLIGRGGEVQESDQILFQGSLPHNEICKYLNASDFFVLPTQAEGCCNAIVEALACGLPVISSDMEFNWDVLNEKNSILLDPNNIEEISAAMAELTGNPAKREAMREAALQTASGLKIENRCRSIFEFLVRTIAETGEV